MANRTIAQVLRMHEGVVSSIEAQLESAGKPKPVNKDFFVKQKEERLSMMLARLNEAKKDKQAVVERIDHQIAVLDKQIAGLAKEIETDRNNLKDQPVPVDPDPTRGLGRLSVRRIRGIGEVAEARLLEHGITKSTEVARMRKAQLAEILGISEQRAAEFIKAAKLVR